ncbi:hypothetical protein C8R44DRAFT_900965 [Mycena epipterygia]|nr:hypothetical protein C8R44DRAFT_900965 [Mycena epipterygia]
MIIGSEDTLEASAVNSDYAIWSTTSTLRTFRESVILTRHRVAQERECVERGLAQRWTRTRGQTDTNAQAADAQVANGQNMSAGGYGLWTYLRPCRDSSMVGTAGGCGRRTRVQQAASAHRHRGRDRGSAAIEGRVVDMRCDLAACRERLGAERTPANCGRRGQEESGQDETCDGRRKVGLRRPMGYGPSGRGYRRCRGWRRVQCLETCLRWSIRRIDMRRILIGDVRVG